MTPTLLGRWQTRVLLMATLGLIVMAIFTLAYRDRTFLIVLGWVIAFGLGWDVLYILMQKLRWDRDWPAAFVVANGVVEGALVYALIRATGLPGIKECHLQAETRYIPNSARRLRTLLPGCDARSAVRRRHSDRPTRR